MERVLAVILSSLFGIFLFAETPDTLRVERHKELQELEVVGVKQTQTSVGAVTNISLPMVNRLRIENFKSVSEVAPNIYIPSYGSKITSTIYSRGLGSRMDQPIVGLSVDNMPVMNKDGYDFEIPDIERIEVLRGAQSLLNGRNTMGGQINIFTLSPWNFSGERFMAEYGRYNSIKLSASVYKTISSVFATSLSALYNQSDGCFTNLYNDSKVGAFKSAALRWKSCWRPNKWASVTNVAAVSMSRQSGYPYEMLSSGKIAYNDTCFYKRNTISDGLTVAWAGKRVVVTSITSVQYLDDNMTLDQDFSTDDYFMLTQKRKEMALTEDLFAKGSRKDYSWLGGVFVFNKRSDMNAPVTFFDTGINRLIESNWNQMNPYYPIKWDSRSFELGSKFKQNAFGLAIYHESKYHLGNWSFNAGLRMDLEHVGLNYKSFCNTGYGIYSKNDVGDAELFKHVLLDINDGGDLSDTYVELLPKISVSYKMNNANVYAVVSRAYKAGGYNTQMFSDVLQQRIMQYMGLPMTYNIDEIVSYKPEKSWNYELGYNAGLFGSNLNLNADVFFIDCRDQQLTMFPPGMTTGRIMTNAGHTYSRGFEISATATPVDDIYVNLSYGFTKATFESFADVKGDYSGKRLPYAPMQTLFAGCDWKLPFSYYNIRPSVNLNLRGVGDIYWNESNLEKQPFYILMGASMALNSPGWSLRIWGENMTSTKYNTFYFTSIGKSFVQRGLPWQMGVTLRLIFSD